MVHFFVTLLSEVETRMQTIQNEQLTVQCPKLIKGIAIMFAQLPRDF